MSKTYPTKHQVVQDFFQNGLIILKNGETGFFCFLRVGDATTILKNVTSSVSRQRGALF